MTGALVAAPLDQRVLAWWVLLCSAAGFNLVLWALSTRQYRRRSRLEPAFANRKAHVILSFIYVLVCGFRGVLPRADVQRICLVDTVWSSVAVGRSVATVAELCCVLQWALIAHEFGRAARSEAVLVLSRLAVGLIVLAECCSWYSVLTTNFLGNTLEESCWTLVAVLMLVSMHLLSRANIGPRLRRHLAFGRLGAVLYVAFMCAVDVRMYLLRWFEDSASGRQYLSLAEGWVDVRQRWVVTGSWDAWGPEMAWMTLYFTCAVWVMVSLTHAPRLDEAFDAV